MGNFLVTLALGVVVAAAPARRIMARRGVAFLLAFSSGLACAALLYLAMLYAGILGGVVADQVVTRRSLPPWRWTLR